MSTENRGKDERHALSAIRFQSSPSVFLLMSIVLEALSWRAPWPLHGVSKMCQDKFHMSLVEHTVSESQSLASADFLF